MFYELEIYKHSIYQFRDQCKGFVKALSRRAEAMAVTFRLSFDLEEHNSI